MWEVGRPRSTCEPVEQRCGCGRGDGGGKGVGQGEQGQQNAFRTQGRTRRVQCAGSCAARSTRSQGLAGEWAISQDVAHPQLISECDFVAAQNIRAARPTADGSTRTYVLVCGLCARRMEAHWINDRAGYRCRQGQTSSRSREPGRAKIRYVREDRLLADLAQRYGLTGAPHGIAAETRARHVTIICEAADGALF